MNQLRLWDRLLGLCPARLQYRLGAAQGSPGGKVREGRKCGRIHAPGLSPSPVSVHAAVLHSGERGVIITALATCTTHSLLPALCHCALVDILQRVRVLH